MPTPHHSSPNGFTFQPSVEAFNVSHDDFIKTSKAFVERVAVSAVVFNPEDKVLLVHRAAKDTFGNLWEVPGGMVDRRDRTILHAVARELQEEANLQTTEIKHQIGCEDLGKIRSGKKASKYSFIVDVDGFDVSLDPKEHQNFIWASKEDVERGCCGKVPLVFTTADQRQVVLDAFQWLQKDRGATAD